MAKAHYVAPESGGLPAELAAILGPDLQDALNHPLRREILRRLNERSQACSPVELLPKLCPFSLSQVSCHTRVLAGAGTVVRASRSSASAGGGYLSNVSDKPEGVAVLWATEREDRELREAALEQEACSYGSEIDQ